MTTMHSPVEIPHPGNHPRYLDLDDIFKVFETSGCAVVPVDTCYGLLAPSTDPKAVSLVRSILNRTDPFPVTVGSVRAANDLLDLRESHRGLLSIAWPGALLAIAKPRRNREARAVVDQVNPKGKLGVRVTTDNLEAALSAECGTPVISPAVRYPDGRPVRSGADARRIVGEAMTARNIPDRKVLFMNRDTFRYPTQSTVGELLDDEQVVNVIREGVYTAAEMQRLVDRVTWRSLAPQVIAPLTPQPGRPTPWSDPSTYDDVT